jgi:hypothetical protein
MEMIKMLNLALRFLLELCALAALGFWGFHTGKGMVVKGLLGLGAPLLAAVVWAIFVSPNASVRVSGLVHLLLEVAVLGSAVVSLYAAGRPKQAAILGVVMVVNRILMTVWQQ